MKRRSNSWQKKMYDLFSVKLHLDSPIQHKEAKQEINFLIKALDLKKDQLIIDVPCGAGRHSLALGKKGYSVLGVDINEVCLKQARKNCGDIKNIRIKKGNMLYMAWAGGKFDILLNLFSSFGFFKTERENEKALKGFVQALKPGGKIAIQTINREYVLKNFVPFQWKETSDFHIIQKRKYDSRTKYIEAHAAFLCKKSKTFDKHFYRVRLYSVSEMKALLKKQGLQKIKVFGNSSGGLVRRFDSSHPFYIAERPDK